MNESQPNKPPVRETLTLLSNQQEKLRRLIYLLASLAGIPAIYIVWLQRRDEDVFIAHTYPFLLFFALGWSGALLWRRVPLAAIERFVLTIVSLLFTSKYAYLIITSRDLTQVWAEVEAVYWVIAFIFIISYIVFERNLAAFFCLGFVVLTALIGGWRFWNIPDALVLEFIRLEIRIAAIGLLLYIFARAKDDLHRTMVEANRIHKLAHTDTLTLLPNRRGLTDTLEERLRQDVPAAVILVDIDYFKRINDTFGHDSGDLILREVGECLHFQLRASDVIGRWGGEEFLIIASEEDAQRASQLAQRLRETVEAHEFSLSIPVTASFGVTIHAPGDTLKSLLQRADQALYRAKNGGRNRVEYQPPH
ncbi:MAG: GGDEF domain-containing protein [Chloroflexota bacterium]|jgi:diguanylate cyclase (GGDEF)-like protein